MARKTSLAGAPARCRQQSGSLLHGRSARRRHLFRSVTA